LQRREGIFVAEFAKNLERYEVGFQILGEFSYGKDETSLFTSQKSFTALPLIGLMIIAARGLCY
jgi:hypothetical protein